MVAVGEAVRQALIHNEGIAPRRVEVIYNGIPLEKFRVQPAAPERAAIRASIGVGPGDLVLIQVARLDYLKDHATAIRTIERVAVDVPRVRLVLVGDGPERAAIESLVRDAGWRSTCDSSASVTTFPVCWRPRTSSCLTSISEGIPLTLIEGMAAGRPVVSTRVGGVAEVVVDGQTGLLAPAGDFDLLAEHILSLAAGAERRDRDGHGGPATGRDVVLRAANA